MEDKNVFVRNEQDKQEGKSFSLVTAFACAFRGIGYTFLSQRNMKIYSAFIVVACLLGFALSIDRTSWFIIIVSIALVLAMECINTAIESIVDLASPSYHELARRAKDCAAGAVLVCSCMALIVAVVIFVPALYALIQ